MRTDAQREAFAKECWEIEKKGGNVLDYIREHWPSYTPGATWYNLQRIYLPEKPLTSGKPETKGGEERMRRRKEETLDAILAAMKAGDHPYDYLDSIGYLNTQQAYYDLRAWAKKNAPEKFEQLPDNLKGFTPKPKSPPISPPEEIAPDLKPGKPLPLKLPKGGKIEAGKPCMLPDPDYSMERLPPAMLPVCAVKSRVHGVWELSAIQGCVSLTWENRITHQEGFLGLTSDEWLMLADEIPVMLKQLGLIKP